VNTRKALLVTTINLSIAFSSVSFSSPAQAGFIKIPSGVGKTIIDGGGKKVRIFPKVSQPKPVSNVPDTT
jgi:hypothetical protein